MRSLLNKVFAQKSASSMRRRPKLAIESLEDRALMAASLTASLNTADGILRIEGTYGDDQIHVRHSGGNVKIDGITIALTEGETTTPSASVARTKITKIVVAALDGNDLVQMHDTLKSGEAAIPMVIHGASGDDTLIGGKGDDSVFGESGVDSILGGNGKDVIYGDANPAAAKVVRDYALYVRDEYRNFLGKDEKWLLTKATGGIEGFKEYYITPKGSLHQYSEIIDGKYIVNDTLLATLDPSYYQDLRKLEFERGLYEYGLYYGTGNREEKWFRGFGDVMSDGWYFITPDGGLNRWDGLNWGIDNSTPVSGTLIDTLDFSYHADPHELVKAATDDGAADILNGQDGDDYIDGGAGNDSILGGSGKDVLYGGLNLAAAPAAASSYLGEGSAVDSSGSNHGILQGNVAFVPGKVGRAFDFDGTADYVDLGSDPSLNLPGSMSVSLWVRLDSLDHFKYFLADFAEDGWTSQGSLGTVSNASVFAWYQSYTVGWGETLAGTTPIQLNQWYNLSVVRDDAAKTVRLYVNGVEESSLSYAGNTVVPLQGSKILGGAGPNWAPDFMDGQLDEVGIYNRALSYAEIQSLYLAGNGITDDDVINGQDGDDSIDGGLGNDFLKGVYGNDTLVGGIGNDTLAGFVGTDLLDGGNGDDSMWGEGDNDTLIGGIGNDTLSGYTGNDSLVGGAGNDSMLGEGGYDTLLGGDGSDDMHGGANDDLISGENDNDLIYGDAGNDLLIGCFNGSPIETGNASDTIHGGDGYDTLYGGDGDDHMAGENGNDLLYGEQGNDDLFGSKFDFNFDVSGASDTIYGGSGNDTLSGGNGNDVLAGEDDNDRLDGGANNDLLFGAFNGSPLESGNPNDTITGGVGNDTRYGGIGDDEEHGGYGDDWLWGEVGNDRMYGEGNNDLMDGGTGGDLMDGGSDNDNMVGGQDYDVMHGGGGNDTLWGASWQNDYTYQDLANKLYGDNGADYLFGGNSLDYIEGGANNDTLRGGLGVNTLVGGDGADILYGGEHADLMMGAQFTSAVETGGINDTLRGYGGNDTLWGGVGNDALWGGIGDDWLNGEDGNDNLNGESGNDPMDGGPGNDVMNGGSDHDNMVGGEGTDVIHGNAGNDSLWGAGWQNNYTYQDVGNFLYGDGDNDNLYGGNGNDYMDAGTGNDGLFGGLGFNTLKGMEGADRFLTWTRANNVNDDTISDAFTEDAVIGFVDSPAMNNVTPPTGWPTTQPYNFLAGIWTAAEIASADQAFGNLHALTGNTKLLELQNGDGYVFTRRGQQTSGAYAFGGQNLGGGNIIIGQLRAATLPTNTLLQTIYHEVGHSWQDANLNNHNNYQAFVDISGWVMNPGDTTNLTQGLDADAATPGNANPWWHLNTAQFARTAPPAGDDYSRLSPAEDWGTTWETYFMDKYHGTLMGNNRVQAKYDSLDLLFNDLRT